MTCATFRNPGKVRTIGLGVMAVLALVVSSCGYAKVQEFQNLTAEELTLKSDEFVCDAGARIQMLSALPAVWIRELKKRDLWECVSEYRRDRGATRVIIQQEKPK